MSNIEKLKYVHKCTCPQCNADDILAKKISEVIDVVNSLKEKEVTK